MMSTKSWMIALAAGLLLAASAVADEAGPKVGGPKSPTSAPGRERSGRNFGSGPLDQALRSANLDDATKAKAVEVLKAFHDKADADAKALSEKRKELNDKYRAESDKDKKRDILKQLQDLKGPTPVEQYQAARAAVKGILTDEQLVKADEAAKANAVELAGNIFKGQVGGWAKDGVELTADQKAKVEAVQAKLLQDAAKEEPGAQASQSLAMKAVWDVRKNVLTPEQQAKLPQPGRPASAPAGK